MLSEPPQDLAAEQATLGGMLLSRAAITEVLEVVNADDFYRPVNASIFTVISELFTAGEPVDPITVSSELERRGKLRNIGGAPYLLDLVQTVPTATNARYYAGIVLDKARMRRLVEFGDRCRQLGYAETTCTEDVDATLAQAEEFFRGIQEPPKGAQTLGELIDEWRTWQNTPDDDIISTPWPELNDYLGGGLRKGKVYVPGGRPGGGKSLFGINIASHVAEKGHTALIISMEMTKKEVTSRLIACGAWASYAEIFRRDMSPDTWMRVEEYLSTKQDAIDRITIEDRPGLTVEQIVAHIRATKPDVVFVDYCQLISPSNTKVQRREQIDHITRTLKICAADARCAIILASQLNRGPTKDGGRAPTVADLRESGGIENDADVVMLLYRPENDEGNVRINVAKNRDGKQGTITMVFRGNIARIGN